MSTLSRQHPDKSLELALQRTLEQNTRTALSKKNVAFILEHQHDSLTQLAAYLKSCKAELGYPPTRTEVIGGDYIEMRFGSWSKALQAAGILDKRAQNALPKKQENTKLYQDEYAAQKILHQQEKARKKEENRRKNEEKRKQVQSKAKAGGAK